ncbi:tetratricopeptide repeat protein [Caloramator australicus]|uniref:Transcriptional regulator n=1 Tax=Caloramator australicus RC3 TaxID=857293 RepID=G0V4Q6_9CLOT|nr:tetratricopeptide repeat protein [Caloramator australicus]CCC58096.1 transcriptional regulator [Caloramator australicus RC3]
MITIGEKIRKRRKELGYTLKEVAGDKVTIAQLSSIENGKSKPSRKLLEYLAEKLKVDVEYFTLNEVEVTHRDFKKIIKTAYSFFNEAKYDEALRTIEDARLIFNNLLNHDRGDYYKFIGECYYNKGEYENAFENFNKALINFSKISDYDNMADSNIKIANSLYMSKKFQMALAYYKSAENLIPFVKDNSIIARIYYDLSLCYYTLDRFRFSKEYLDKCLDFIKEKDLSSKTDLIPYINMMAGIIDLKVENVRESLEKFQEAFEKYKLNGDMVGMGRAMNNIGICYMELEEYDRALSCFKEAIDYKIIGNDEEMLDPYLNMIEIYEKKGDRENILTVLNDAESNLIKLNDISTLIDVYILKMEYYIKEKDFDKAEIYGFLALDNAERIKNIDKLNKIYIALSKLYRMIGNENLSIEYMLKVKK